MGKRSVFYFLVSLTLAVIYGEYTGIYSSNSDIYLTTPEVAQKYGYPSETHYVTTEDGFILALHRIPGNKNGVKGKQPVFLQHGLFDSSNTWVDVVNVSLAFLLADNGYDVWMGNARANTYSFSHTKYLPTDFRFWNYSFHEMGLYDTPANLNYISRTTGKHGEIIYIGHSQGGTTYFAFNSMLPNVAKTVKVMVGLAPAVFFTHTSFITSYIANLAVDNRFLFKLFGIYKLDINNLQYRYFFGNRCIRDKILQNTICKGLLDSVYGESGGDIPEEDLAIIVAHSFDTTAVKDLLHFAQLIKIRGKRFQMYDYGRAGNLRQYHSRNPEQYNLKNVQVPVYIYYGRTDSIVSQQDSEMLAETLPNTQGLYRVPRKKFDHIDFLFSGQVRELVYNPMLNILKQYQIGSGGETKNTTEKTNRRNRKRFG